MTIRTCSTSVQIHVFTTRACANTDLKNPDFSLYAGSTHRLLTVEYLRWLITQGAVPVDFAELLQAQAANLEAGAFRFCVCAFSLWYWYVGVSCTFISSPLSSWFCVPILTFAGQTTTNLAPYPTSRTHVDGTSFRNNPVLLAPDGKTILRDFATTTMGLQGMFVFTSIHMSDVTSIEWGERECVVYWYSI